MMYQSIIDPFCSGLQDKRKKKERWRIPQYQYLYSDCVATSQNELPHHPFGTSSERRSPQRKPRLGLAGFEPTTSDRGNEKPIPDEGDGFSLKD